MLTYYGLQPGLMVARKHVGWYSKGLPGSSEFRAQVNQVHEPERVRDLIRGFYDPQLERMAA